MPHRIRYLIAFDRALCADVRRIFVRAVQAFLRRRARRAGIRKGRCGAVVFLQRFGGSVNLNPHFHALVLDGVYAAAPGQDAPAFHPLCELEYQEVHALTWKIRDKVLRLLMKKGHLAEDASLEEERLPFDSPVCKKVTKQETSLKGKPKKKTETKTVKVEIDKNGKMIITN